METRIFHSGNSQAVRIPKALRFSDDIRTVEIIRQGDALIIRPKRTSLAEIYALLDEMPEDFMATGRPEDPPPQRRDDF